MGRAQNGPSFGKATYKAKPPTEEELVRWDVEKREWEAAAIERARRSRFFSDHPEAFGFAPRRRK
jgi:hypothetical protein